MTVLYPCVNYLMFHYTNRLHLQKWFPAGKNQMLELQVFCRGESVLQTVRSGVKTCSQLLGWSSYAERRIYLKKNCLKKKAAGSKGENNHCPRCARDIESQDH